MRLLLVTSLSVLSVESRRWQRRKSSGLRFDIAPLGQTVVNLADIVNIGRI